MACTANPASIKDTTSSLKYISNALERHLPILWITSLENSIDVAHVNFVHSDFGDEQNGTVTNIEVKWKSEDHLRMYSSINHKSESLALKFTEMENVRVRHDILLPNTVVIRFFVKDVMEVITYVTYTPLQGNSTLLNWSFLRNPKIPVFDGILDYAFMKGMEKAILEDKAIVESLEKAYPRVTIETDKVQAMFRSRLKDMVMSEPSMDHQ